MSAFKQNIRRFCLRAATVLFIAMIFCFCSAGIARFLRPRLTSNYIIAVDSSGKEYIYRTTGISEYIGKIAHALVGGNFADVSTVAGTVSGNLTYDEEKPSYIEDMPIAEKKPDENVLEKTVSSGEEEITINNETSYPVLAEELSDSPAFSLGEGTEVIIVHSHSTESYAPTENYRFSHTSEDRTTDTDYNMVRIGAELKKELESKGISCEHITDLFDYPEYNNSYARSCKAVEAALSDNPGTKIVLDLHRDSIINSEGVKTKLTTAINGEKVAQVMLVVGTDELGLKHDNWRTNLQFAAHFQKFLLAQEKNFARPINLRTSRFNGHTAPGAVIVEVGTGANTIEEALASAKHIANALEEVIKFYD